MRHYEPEQLLYRGYIPGGANFVQFDIYYVVRPTPKGAWVCLQRDSYQPEVELKKHGLLRWIPEDSRRCSKTKERAIERLRARNRSYLKHCRRRLQEAERREKILNEGHPRLLNDEPTFLRLWPHGRFPGKTPE